MVGVVAKFSDARMSLVDRGMLGEPTAGLAHCAALLADPVTTSWGLHGGEMGGEGKR